MAKQAAKKDEKSKLFAQRMEVEKAQTLEDQISNYSAARGINKGEALFEVVQKAFENEAKAARNEDTFDLILDRVHAVSEVNKRLQEDISEIKTVLKLIAFKGDPDAVLRYYQEVNQARSDLEAGSNPAPTLSANEIDLISMFSEIKTSNDNDTSSETGLHHKGMATVAGTKRVERNFMKKMHSAS